MSTGHCPVTFNFYLCKWNINLDKDQPKAFILEIIWSRFQLVVILYILCVWWNWSIIKKVLTSNKMSSWQRIVTLPSMMIQKFIKTCLLYWIFCDHRRKQNLIVSYYFVWFTMVESMQLLLINYSLIIGPWGQTIRTLPSSLFRPFFIFNLWSNHFTIESQS